MSSTHEVTVVPVRLEPHPNADRLAIVRVWGYTAIVAKDAWSDGALGAYLPPDSLVDVSRPEFAFLAGDAKPKYGGKARIKAKKLRGVWSQGLLVRAPAGSADGQDVAELLHVEHYEPLPDLTMSGPVAPPPRGFVGGAYDLESWRKYGASVFVPGETVIVTEKIHGTSARFTCVDGAMNCGSRSQWKVDTPGDPWWEALRCTPPLRAFCETHPGIVVYGEVYGHVQDLRYGTRKSEIRFACFDMRRPDGSWLDADEWQRTCDEHGLPMVPLLWVGPYSPERIEELAEGPSQVPGADHVREGCVVRPVRERWHEEAGRAVLKIVGNGYLEKA
jgi:RNA ligase (TIGR02306 family)